MAKRWRIRHKLLLGLGLVYFTFVSAGGSYVGDLLPGFLLIGVGGGFSFVDQRGRPLREAETFA